MNGIAASLPSEGLSRDGGSLFRVDVLGLAGAQNVLQMVEDYAQKEPDELLQLIKREFDEPGLQEARKVWPKAVEKADLRDGVLNVRVQFEVTYANPVDKQDGELTAENVTEHVENLSIEAVATGLDWVSVDLAPYGPFR
jgi:hypothetical protein